MKLLLIIALALGLTACGKKDSDGGGSDPIDYYQTCEADALFVGGWSDSALNEIDLGGDCFGGTTDSCDLRFTYYKPVNNQVLIDVNTTNGGSCLSEGEHICTFVHEDVGTADEFLLINCGDGDIYYFPK